MTRFKFDNAASDRTTEGQTKEVIDRVSRTTIF